ncbi:FmdE family protein [Methanohalophilus sp.]|uniref:FmdE family protein n=1 Tax=Methanohalophilus sp. TaxID=1966352 RepID=UPI002607375E|nr:FmdE family protein [Methanohalophilus sp.]MDK2892375.1 formylmethanofuran dehydrogenase subunit [Methanohalophilus sp.]
MENIINEIEKQDPQLYSQVEKIIPFHGYLSTGAFIGLQMLNMAKRILDVKEGERIYAVSETYNCLPDPFQILEGATIGNKGLRVKDYGKMAVTVNKRAEKGISSVKGVRIYLDPDKMAEYPKLHAWYMNTAKVPHEEVLPELLKAGESVYSYEMVDIEVPLKMKKKVRLCEKCGESFVQYEDEALCPACNDN